MILSYKYHTFNIPLWLLRLLKRHTVYVRAAGGIVTAPDGTMLLILRNGRWDLAKGKVEPGETLLQAALREVQEETGIKASDECGVMSVEPIDPTNSSLITHHSSLITNIYAIKTYHLFRAPRAWYSGPNPPAHRWHLKQTSWFPMTAEKQPVNPQLEEGITGGQWVTPSEWHRRLQTSYGTLRTLSKKLLTHNS